MTSVNSGDSLLPVLKNEIRAVRTALWFRPTAYCTLAILLAVLVATVDGFLPKDLLDWLPKVKQATVEELLKLLAGGMLTVATVTLSVLMLVLSIAAIVQMRIYSSFEGLSILGEYVTPTAQNSFGNIGFSGPVCSKTPINWDDKKEDTKLVVRC